jgi:HPt (histidine-containing phosphotransfer) domain-containing protein
MRKSSSLVGVFAFFVFCCATPLMNCIGLGNASPTAHSDSHRGSMELFLNPELRTRMDLLLWALQYDSLFTTMVVSDSAVTKEDLRLIDIIREFIPNFINYDNVTIAEKLFIAFHKDVQNRTKLIAVLQNAYTEISSIFRHELNLEAPEGFIFVLVFKDRQQIGDEEIGGFVIRASRFVVIPQAYYFQRGFVLFDFDQFYTIFKHELVHAFINSLAGYDLAIDFPEWFHEMAAISLGGNRKFETKGETIHKLSVLYQEYYDAAKHLQRKFGRTKYHIFFRESIRNGDPLQRLTEHFGYESYDELRWDSMSIAEKTFETLDRFFIKMRNWLGKRDFFTSIFVILMLALPFFFAYSLVRENVDRMKKLSNVFKNAGRLQLRGDLVDSLQHYRFFLTNVHHALGWEQFLISARNKIQDASERVNDLQTMILSSMTSEIQENRIADILTAEKKCFALEQIKNSLLKDEFHTLAEEYLSNNATAIIAEAWVQRDVQLKNLCKRKHYFDAIQEVIEYVRQNWKSAFCPQAHLAESFNSIIQSIKRGCQKKSSFIRACFEIDRIKSIASQLKHDQSLYEYYSSLNDLIVESKPYRQVRNILKKIKKKAIESNLFALKALLNVIESNPSDRVLKEIVLSFIDEKILDNMAPFFETSGIRAIEVEDVMQFQIILAD